MSHRACVAPCARTMRGSVVPHRPQGQPPGSLHQTRARLQRLWRTKASRCNKLESAGGSRCRLRTVLSAAYHCAHSSPAVHLNGLPLCRSRPPSSVSADLASQQTTSNTAIDDQEGRSAVLDGLQRACLSPATCFGSDTAPDTACHARDLSWDCGSDEKLWCSTILHMAINPPIML